MIYGFHESKNIVHRKKIILVPQDIRSWKNWILQELGPFKLKLNTKAAQTQWRRGKIKYYGASWFTCSRNTNDKSLCLRCSCRTTACKLRSSSNYNTEENEKKKKSLCLLWNIQHDFPSVFTYFSENFQKMIWTWKA